MLAIELEKPAIGERFRFMFPRARYVEQLRVFNELAQNEDSSFTWLDACKASEMVKRLVG